ncbi:MAG: hypothetical protein HPY50_16760 [Firmicutes bacterium]|nr:hypothetical protein [Bacillota bacterium]
MDPIRKGYVFVSVFLILLVTLTLFFSINDRASVVEAATDEVGFLTSSRLTEEYFIPDLQNKYWQRTVNTESNITVERSGLEQFLFTNSTSSVGADGNSIFAVDAEGVKYIGSESKLSKAETIGTRYVAKYVKPGESWWNYSVEILTDKSDARTTTTRIEERYTYLGIETLLTMGKEAEAAHLKKETYGYQNLDGQRPQKEEADIWLVRGLGLVKCRLKITGPDNVVKETTTELVAVEPFK